MPAARRLRAFDRGTSSGSLCVVLALALLGQAALASDTETDVHTQRPGEDEEFFPLDEFVGDDGLSGDEIYRRVLANRFDAFEQVSAMRSGSESGRFQDVRLRLRYKNFRRKSKRVVSKTIAKYYQPSDVRHLGYLVINKQKGPDDQFVYRPSARKVRRVNVRGEAIAGTDFSFEDVVPPEFEDGSHHRMPDAEVNGRPVYVVTVIPHPETESEYAKLVISIEKDHYVPIRTLYWDNKRALIKQLDAELDSLVPHQAREDGELKEVWVAMRSRMKQLKLETYTDLELEQFEADPSLRDRHFSERELTASR